MSVLRPESLRLLREHAMKPRAPLWFKVLPRTDGWWLAFETGRPNNHGVRGAYTSPGAALLAIEELLAKEAAAGRLEAA